MRSIGLLDQHWQEVLRAQPDRTAVIEAASSRRYTFAGLEHLAASRAEQLAAGNPSAGDRVVAQLPNSVEFIAMFLASLRLRLVMAPIDPKLAPAETHAIARHIGARWLVRREGTERIESDGNTARSVSPPAGTALLKLTSGSTGAPKGIALTDSQLLADSANICSTMKIRPDDLNFAVIPLSHSYGFDNLVLPLIAQGTPMAVLDEMLPRAVIEGLAATRATVFPAVPFLLDTLNHLPDPLPPLPSLRTVISAGAPLSAEVYHAFRRRFGLRIHQFYGSSECGGITYIREPTDEFLPGCVGTPMDNVAVDLVENGRVRARGANVASGYFPSLPPGEEQSIRDGMYQTGDLGRFDEPGRLHLVGRVAGFINVAGRKVNPAEIEQCILQIPAVRHAFVIGVADARRHESIVAFVLARDGQTVEDAEVLRHCRSHLASWKVPRAVKRLDSLPLTPSGKPDRMVLKQMV